MKILQLFLILLFSSSFGQKVYEFDYMIHYNWESEGKNGNVLYYINSKNTDNFIKIFSNENQYTAKLFSYQNKKMYDFDVNQKIKNGEVSYDFIYVSTMSLRYNSKTPVFKYTIISDGIIQLDIFGNKKQTKIKQSHLMKIKPYEINLFPAYRMLAFHPYEFQKELDYPNNVFVEESTLTFESGQIIKEKLQEIRRVDFKITIPKDEKY